MIERATTAWMKWVRSAGWVMWTAGGASSLCHTGRTRLGALEGASGRAYPTTGWAQT